MAIIERRFRKGKSSIDEAKSRYERTSEKEAGSKGKKGQEEQEQGLQQTLFNS